MYKKLSIMAAGISMAALLGACNETSTTKQAIKLDNQTDKASYTIGVQMGTQMKSLKEMINQDALLLGFQDSIDGKDPQLSKEEMQTTMQAFQQSIIEKEQAKQQEIGSKNAAEGEKFLTENKSKEGVKITESGLQYLVLKEGTGEIPKATDKVVTHYTGTLIDGKVFDSSYKRNSPAEFPVNGVIKGWTEALQLMKVGAKWKLFVPSELAYGSRGVGANIGPNQVLIFEIELLEIKKS